MFKKNINKKLGSPIDALETTIGQSNPTITCPSLFVNVFRNAVQSIFAEDKKGGGVSQCCLYVVTEPKDEDYRKEIRWRYRIGMLLEINQKVKNRKEISQ